MKATTLKARARYQPRDSSGSATRQLVVALLAGNVCATVCVAAFRPFPGQHGFPADGGHLNMVLTVGTMSLVASGLLFLLSAVRRRQRPWWTILMAVDALQVARLGPALVAIGMWNQDGDLGVVVWGFLVVPTFGVLAAIGLIVTAREMRRSKRRRLSRAA